MKFQKMGYKSNYLILFLSFFFFSHDNLIFAEPLLFEIRGESGLLMNSETGILLFEKDAHTPHYPASTTKVAAALYALKLKGDNLEMPIAAEQEALVTITPEKKRNAHYHLPPYWLETDGCHISIKNGEVLTLHDLLKGMLISSANDAANVIAHTLGSTIPVFMEGLNAYLKELGCLHTHFCNPHGLHHPDHVSTAYDLALMAQEALKSDVICKIVSQSKFLRPKTNKQAASVFLQGNRLLRTGKFYYARAIGVKTGYHAKAKNTFIGAAQFDGRTLISVLMGYQDRKAMFEDAIKMFEAAFNQPKIRRIFLKEGLQNFSLNLPKANHPLQSYIKEPLYLEYYPAEDPQAKCLLYWHSLILPVAKDQQIGHLQLVSAKGNILKEVPLLAYEGVTLSWAYNLMKINSFKIVFIILLIVLMILVIIRVTKSAKFSKNIFN